MTLRECSSAHCSGADAAINEVCKIAGWPIDHRVPARDDGGPCTSCYRRVGNRVGSCPRERDLKIGCAGAGGVGLE